MLLSDPCVSDMPNELRLHKLSMKVSIWSAADDENDVNESSSLYSLFVLVARVCWTAVIVGNASSKIPDWIDTLYFSQLSNCFY